MLSEAVFQTLSPAYGDCVISDVGTAMEVVGGTFSGKWIVPA